MAERSTLRGRLAATESKGGRVRGERSRSHGKRAGDSGRDLSEIALESVAGLTGVVIDAPGEPATGIVLRAEEETLTGRAVLVRTGWDERWGAPDYWEGGPYLSNGSVDLLVRSKAALVGVDFSNVDDTSDRSRPVHTQLLRANILIVEHRCNLALLPRHGFAFSAVPLRIVRGASFSVRAFAEIPSR